MERAERVDIGSCKSAEEAVTSLLDAAYAKAHHPAAVVRVWQLEADAEAALALLRWAAEQEDTKPLPVWAGEAMGGC